MSTSKRGVKAPPSTESVDSKDKAKRKVRAQPHTIKVTAEAIEKAVRGDSSHCMIADAIQDQFPDVRNVFVDLQTIRWTDRGKGVRFVYLTPRVAQQALADFDDGVEFGAFDFRLTRHMTQVVPMKKRNAKGSKPARQPAGKRTLVRESNGVTVVMGGSQPPRAALASGGGKRREHGIAGLRRSA